MGEIDLREGREMIYMDSAATSYHRPEAVIRAVADAMRRMGSAGRGAHGASLDASRLVFETRERLAVLFGSGNPATVAFTANSTESLNLAIQGLLGSGDHVITTQLEHNSVLRPLYRMEECGMELTVLPADRQGRLNYGDLERALKERTRAVVCTHASNLTGNLVDIRRVGEFCRRNGLLFLLDASQTAGVFPIHMGRDHIDVVCFTGHKSLMGPQGIGGICVRQGLEIRPLVVGGSGIHSYSKKHPGDMPAALEAGTLNVHGIAGLNAALEFIGETGMDRIRRRETELARRLCEGFRRIPGVRLYGGFSEEERAPIVSINVRDYDSGQVADELFNAYEISVRAGAHCAPLMHQALGTVEQGAVRFSLSYFNTEDEVRTAVEAVKEIAS